jgi:hypothetical protein
MKSELQVTMSGLWNGCIIYEWLEIHANFILHVTMFNINIHEI